MAPPKGTVVVATNTSKHSGNTHHAISGVRGGAGVGRPPMALTIGPLSGWCAAGRRVEVPGG